MNTNLSLPPYPTVSQSIRLRRPASITSGPRGEAAMTDIVHAVVTTSVHEAIRARMDQPLADMPVLSPMVDEIWQNCVEWKGADCASTFLSDCELLSSSPPFVGQRLRLVRDVARGLANYFLDMSAVMPEGETSNG